MSSARSVEMPSRGSRPEDGAGLFSADHSTLRKEDLSSKVSVGRGAKVRTGLRSSPKKVPRATWPSLGFALLLCSFSLSIWQLELKGDHEICPEIRPRW